MKRFICVAVLALACAAPLVLGGPLQPRPQQKLAVLPNSREPFQIGFKAHKPAKVLAIGDGHTFLGLYVFDRHGNCVAWDDVSKATPDDLAVEWVPAETDPHTVEVVNFGGAVNRFTLVVR